MVSKLRIGFTAGGRPEALVCKRPLATEL